MLTVSSTRRLVLHGTWVDVGTRSLLLRSNTVGQERDCRDGSASPGPSEPFVIRRFAEEANNWVAPYTRITVVP